MFQIKQRYEETILKKYSDNKYGYNALLKERRRKWRHLEFKHRNQTTKMSAAAAATRRNKN